MSRALQVLESFRKINESFQPIKELIDKYVEQLDYSGKRGSRFGTLVGSGNIDVYSNATKTTLLAKNRPVKYFKNTSINAVLKLSNYQEFELLISLNPDQEVTANTYYKKDFMVLTGRTFESSEFVTNPANIPFLIETVKKKKADSNNYYAAYIEVGTGGSVSVYMK